MTGQWLQAMLCKEGGASGEDVLLAEFVEAPGWVSGDVSGGSEGGSKLTQWQWSWPVTGVCGGGQVRFGGVAQIRDGCLCMEVARVWMIDETFGCSVSGARSAKEKVFLTVRCGFERVGSCLFLVAGRVGYRCWARRPPRPKP